MPYGGISRCRMGAYAIRHRRHCESASLHRQLLRGQLVVLNELVAGVRRMLVRDVAGAQSWRPAEAEACRGKVPGGKAPKGTRGL